MRQVKTPRVDDERKLLVERIAASRYVSRSARLRDLLVYLSERVLEDEAGEIHEQELGHKVFGRPPDYDTTADNIVRVHASMLRKRLEQYFSSEGAAEPLVVEVPKGNYALVFRPRLTEESPPPAAPAPRSDWRLWALAAAAVLFACSTAILLLRPQPLAVKPEVRRFWSQVFRSGQTTDIVLDDAAVALYQELSGRPLTLSDYFDRGYLRTLPDTAAAAKLDEQAASAMVLRRHSSFASASFLWKLFQVAGADVQRTNLQFARDYNFRGLKSDNAVLLGNSRANPWVEPFESKMGLRWNYDKASNLYTPVDTVAGKTYAPGEMREGYSILALLPNLGGTGNVLIVTATGGSAMNATADFLSDEHALQQLQSARQGAAYFEALLRLKGRGARDTTIVTCRKATELPAAIKRDGSDTRPASNRQPVNEIDYRSPR